MSSTPDDGQGDGRGWQRLDKWLWCARFLRQRSDCARLIAAGTLRVNRQPTDKAHAKLRVGDVLTLALGQTVRVVVVEALADRRGAAVAARALYREIPEASGGCGSGDSTAYRPSGPPTSQPSRSA